MVASSPEVEWDDTERAWMLALDEWRRTEVCSACGWPRSVCQAPETEFRLEVDRVRCHVASALSAAQKDYAKDETARPEGLLWFAKVRPDN